MTSAYKLRIQKHKLNNGLTILARPVHNVPQVDVQLWYNVGSKDESNGERGMAHLLEHMIFKGSKKFSESDINLITHKLAGYSNAFTSYDYTSYVFRFPSNSWKAPIDMLAECMQNCRFDEQMLSSELKAVIQEMKIYKDDYYSSVIENLYASVFSHHPYHHPIIGYKQDLWNINRNNLLAFYKKHYHPSNALLVVVGDINPGEIFKYAKHAFGGIAPKPNYSKEVFFSLDDISSKSVTLYREVETPWTIYAYKIPGSTQGKTHINDMLALLLGQGRSSRLYASLVDAKQLATDVNCFCYDLFEDELFFIAVTPKNIDVIPEIEKTINEEIAKIINNGIADWEFERIRKKAEMDYLTLLENNEQQATSIATFYLASGDEYYIEKFLNLIINTKPQDLIDELKEKFRPEIQNKGYLLPIPKNEIPYLNKIQEESDAMDEEILEKRERRSRVEPGKFVNSIEIPNPVDFSYPKPSQFSLKNGLNVMWHHNPLVPKISIILELKASFLYEDESKAGLSEIHSQMLLEGTLKKSYYELHKFLETNGILISCKSGYIALEFLAFDLQKALGILAEILNSPCFRQENLSKIKEQQIVSIKEYWDTPNRFIDQIARKYIYKSHPYSKNILGSLESVSEITLTDVVEYHQKFISPKGATLSIVGDLSHYGRGSHLENIFENNLGSWSGEIVEDLVYPEIEPVQKTLITHEINRDQVVVAFVGESISRKDPVYDQLALLDLILTGGESSTMSSRLFALREQTGLFYTIGGSLMYHSSIDRGMVFIKTIVSPSKVSQTEEAVLEVLYDLSEKGISREEFLCAKNVLVSSAIEHFESNNDIAKSFLFLKKFNFPFDLFDKRGATLSILDIESVHQVAKQYCNPKTLSVIRVGRQN